MTDLKTNPIRTHCIRCGECCLKSSPSLQLDDKDLVTGGLIQTQNLYTVRTGELVYNNIIDQPGINKQELIKVKTRNNNSQCIFYDDQEMTCQVYNHRPVQCSALTCWDEKAFMAVHQSPRLTRSDVIEDTVLCGLMAEHEKKCNYKDLESLVQDIESKGNKAIHRILDKMKFDYQIRPFVSRKLGIDMDDMDFIFGRPLTETIVMFGLQVTREPDGAFLLTACPETK